MKRLSILCLCALFLLPAFAADARQVQLAKADQPYTIQVLHSDLERSVIHLEINHFDLNDIEIDGRGYQAVTLGSRALHMERGLPALPTIRESLRIPDDAAMTLRVIDSEIRSFTGLDVAPSKGNILRNVDPAMVSYAFDPFYSGDGWYPDRMANLDTPYIMRDTRGVVLAMNPFRYNPSSSTLEVTTSLTVEVVADGPGRVNVLADKPATPVQEFEAIYESHYLNHAGAMGDRYVSIPEVGSMLVISYDAFYSAAQPFVDWKNQMGIPTTHVNVSAVGATATQIKAYIQNLYDTEGLCFVVLVGDVAQIPYYNNGGASDPSYGFLAGADSYPEVFIGRLSAENPSQVQTQVERSIEYERDAQAGASWYGKGMGIASSEGAGNGDDGEADYVHMGYIRDDLLAFTYSAVDELYEPGASYSQVTTGCNDGRSIINYCGHGWLSGWSTTGFDNNGVNALTNDNMLPFITSVACNTGEFQSGTCFGEAWMRATNGTEPTGSVGFYGSTISMSWAPPMCAQDEIVDLLVAGAKRTFAGLCVNGSCQMIDEYGSTGETEMKMWTIFGDPSLRVRTDSPAATAVSHFGTVDPMMGSFSVDTDPGNLAAISYNGQFIGSAFADAGGVAEITFVGDLPMPGNNVTLTVSGFNRFTHVEDVLVGDSLVPTCEVSPGAFNKVLIQDQVLTDWLHITNNGELGSTLYYSVELSDPNFPTNDGGIGLRNIAGSTLSVDLPGFYPGMTYDVVFSAYCESPDNEWLKGIAFDLPPGVVLNSATAMAGGSGGDIAYNGATGDGADGAWVGTGTWGNIYPGETGTATVSLSFTGAAGDVVIPYTLDGDVYGGDPHQVTGEIVIPILGPNVTVLSPNGGELCAVGEDLTIEWSAGGGPTLVDVELTRDGTSWETLATGLFAAAGSYNWTATGPITPNARVRVTDAGDPGVTDASDTDFTIYRELTWVQMSTFSGSVPQGDTASLEVTFDSTGLPEGFYEADITVDSNAGGAIVVPAFIQVAFDLTDVPIAPAALRLAQNHPNPFNPKTMISFALPAEGPASLKVYDVEGRMVRTLLEKSLPAGDHHVVWDGTDDAGQSLATGVYFYRVLADGETQTRKMLLLK